MPTTPFQASLLDDAGAVSASLSSDCKKLTVTDESNYDTTDEAGHSRNDFSEYRTLLVRDMAGNEFEFSSVNGDDDFPTPDTSNDSVVFDVTTGDGVYELILTVIPTWDNTVSYKKSENDHVYFDDGDEDTSNVWEAVGDSTGVEPGTDENKWKEVAEGDLEELPSKYRVIEKIVITCNLMDCIKDKVHKYRCKIDDCEPTLRRQVFDDIRKLQIARVQIKWAAEASKFEEAKDPIRLTKKLCNC